MNYIEQVSNKRKAQKETKQAEQAVSAFLDKVKTASYDDKDLKDELKQVGKALEKLSGMIPPDNTKAIESLAEKLSQSIKDSAPKIDNKEVVDSLKKLIDKKMSVTYSPPKVEVTNEVDVSPIRDAISELKEEKGIDLDDYIAHDISEKEGYQYIGFVNPAGNWYIIKNDIKGNSMRFLFGEDDYSKAFKNASSYMYKVINEAV